MRDTAVVTGCDRSYLPLLRDLLENLRDLGVAAFADVYVFDIDFTPAEREEIASYDVTVRQIAGEPIDVANKDPGRRHLVSTIRPVLPDVFPGHQTYVYLDVDLWFQYPAGLKGIIAAAETGDLVVVAEDHPDYGKRDPASWTAVHAPFYPPEIVGELARRPYLNGGIIAGSARSSAWRKWAQEYRTVADRSGIWFGAGQASLPYLALTGRVSLRVLPAVYNWMCHLAVPVWEPSVRRLMTRTAPRQAILTVHLTGATKHDLAYSKEDGRKLAMPLRYPAIRALQANER